ncbi:MAG: BtrH N-terminal domain-containing protein [Caldilineaceae bacterium]
MPTLPNYTQFDGLHWETGSIRNALDYQGIKAPHTGQPISEALLMGISGGAVMGYFSFAYEGYDPHVVILTRNTFDPWDRLLSRLGIVQEIKQTTKTDKAVTNLTQTLEDGAVPIVWADVCSMPYSALYQLEGYWHMYPHVVYSYEPTQDRVKLADRARVPLEITTPQLALARGKVKKTDYRIVTLDLPGFDKLASAVHLGIDDCIKLYTEKPPKGSKDNFGFAAYQRWIEMLTKPTARLSWEKEFPRGVKLYEGLITTYRSIMIDGKEGQAERHMFADFLDEAAIILQKPALTGIATQFRSAGRTWNELACALLPDSVGLLKEAREVMWNSYQAFLNRGADTSRLQARNERLRTIKTHVSNDFPLSHAEVIELRLNIADHVQKIHDIEFNAINELKQAMV